MHRLNEKTTKEIKGIYESHKDVIERWTRSGSTLEKSLASMVIDIAST